MLVTIAQHKFILSKLCQVFHNSILVVKIVGFFLKPTIVNPHNTVNHPIFNAHNDFLHSQNKLTIAQNKLIEQMIQLTSMCEMAYQIIQKKQEEKRIEEEQEANAQYWKIPACCDDDDDYNSAITPNEPIDSLSMRMSFLTLFRCDVLACFTTFSNILFDADYEFDSVDDQSCSDEDVPEKIFSNPLFEKEIIPIKIDQHHFNAESDLIESMVNHDYSIIPSSLKIDSLLDEFADELTLLKSIPPGIDKTDCYPEEDISLIERLLYDNSSPRPPEEFDSENSNADIESFFPSPIPVEDSDSHMEEIDLPFTPDDPMPPSIEDDDYDSERDGNTGILNIKMMGNISDQKLSAKCPMMIHGKNIPIPDVSLFHFYPIDQFKYRGN
uniref:Reverse transcriptase domain-containing protein n=1 Tax=Tanacetum cinerariifolium TaxID=118510 RepID=A0A6L2LMC7_TANCI|nr:hypothetical protein [Tanacetum cinerariifolium]